MFAVKAYRTPEKEVHHPIPVKVDRRPCRRPDVTGRVCRTHNAHRNLSRSASAQEEDLLSVFRQHHEVCQAIAIDIADTVRASPQRAELDTRRRIKESRWRSAQPALTTRVIVQPTSRLIESVVPNVGIPVTVAINVTRTSSEAKSCGNFIGGRIFGQASRISGPLWPTIQGQADLPRTTTVIEWPVSQ